MKCLSCDTILTDIEATRKFEKSNDFVDLCNYCFLTISDEVEVIENQTLSENLNDSKEDESISAPRKMS
jgi:hypothetical protein